jgi:hypothetical protein
MIIEPRPVGLRQLLSQQLNAAGERVLDVPPSLAAGVPLMASGQINKTDAKPPARWPSPRCVAMTFPH